MSVGGVSRSSLIPALLFILPMTLIPYVSDPETPANPLVALRAGPQLSAPMLCRFAPS